MLVVAVVLIGGLLFSAWVRGRGGDDGDSSAAAAEKTAQRDEADSSATAARTRTPTAPATQRTGATAAPGGARRDLEGDEVAGGHTLSRHTGKTEAQLRQRLKDEPDISAASTYSDKDAAERTVELALSKNAAKVRTWEKASSHPNLVLRVTMASNVGRSLKRGDSAAKSVKDAVVVLKWDSGDWYVLTSYPEER